MFSTSTFFSLVSLSLLSSASLALPLQGRDTADTNKNCAHYQPGELCTINGQAYNSNTTYFDQNVTLNDSFDIEVSGKVGLSNAMRYLSLDFEGVAYQQDTGFYEPSSEFFPVTYNITKDLAEGKNFAYDGINVPCGLNGKYFLNVSIWDSLTVGEKIDNLT